MPKFISCIIGFCIIFLVGACNTGGSVKEDGDSIVELSPMDFHDKTNQKLEGVLLDIRDPAKFNEGALWGAVNLSYLDPNFETAIDQLASAINKKPVFIYCQNGASSNRVAKLLSSKGIQEIYIMSGGYQAWINSGV